MTNKQTIKLNNVEVSVDEIRQLVKDNPGLLKEEKPLGDDFSMLSHWKLLDKCLGEVCGPEDVSRRRLNALIKIWEWKHKNDNTISKNGWHFGIILSGSIKDEKKLELEIGEYVRMVSNSELPQFSSWNIALRARKELEKEFKIAYNI